MKAVLCPVCNGSGQLQDIGLGTTTASLTTQCHGCDGKGWVEVGESGDWSQPVLIPDELFPGYTRGPWPDSPVPWVTSNDTRTSACGYWHSPYSGHYTDP